MTGSNVLERVSKGDRGNTREDGKRNRSSSKNYVRNARRKSERKTSWGDR